MTGQVETVIARLRPHGRALFWPTVLLLAVAGMLGFFAGVIPDGLITVAVLAVAGVVVLVGWLVPLLRWLARNYTITSRRVIVRSGILVRSRQEMLHSRVQHVTLRRSGMQSLFRSGDIELEGDSENPVVLRDVPSAGLVQDTLHDLAEDAGPSFPSDRVRS